MDFNEQMEQFKEMNNVKAKLAEFMKENDLSIRVVNGDIVINFDYYKDGGEPIVLAIKKGCLEPIDLID